MNIETATTVDLAALFDKEPFDRPAFDALKEAAFDSDESLNRFLELVSGLERRTPASGGADPGAAYKLGLCYLVLADQDRAASMLEKAQSIPQHGFYLAQARRDQRRFAEALTLFESAAKSGVDPLECDLERAECFVLTGDMESARQILSRHLSAAPRSPTYHYVRGRLAEESGELAEAMDEYEAALNIDPAHAHAMFRLAYLLDLHGNDERAHELYLQSSEQPFVYVNALINLAVNFEDMGEYENAASCLDRVLSVNPNHPRALLYLKDVLASQHMFIDETQIKAREQHDAVLDIPVTDFELSVRSRNCLKKMNINTLGDLLRTTEQELLAYKNFGETSLREIRAMLSQKGLSLGQNAQQKPAAEHRTPALALPAPMTEVGPDMLARQVATLELSVRSRKCLQRLGITTIGDLLNRSESELLESRNFGHTSLKEIKGRLTEMGISLKTA